MYFYRDQGNKSLERVVLTIRERASTPPFTQEVLVACVLGSWSVEMMLYVYVVASEYVTARLRRH
jgi:hypothetical protein